MRFMGRKAISLELGLRRNMLTVIGDVFVRGKYSFVVCRCDCGAQKTVSASAMARGVVKSCGGCSLLAANSFKHGMSRTREHRAWCSMIERCENKHCKAYKNYGARGIYVCERWHDFSAFYSDVGDRRAGLSRCGARAPRPHAQHQRHPPRRPDCGTSRTRPRRVASGAASPHPTHRVPHHPGDPQ